MRDAAKPVEHSSLATEGKNINVSSPLDLLPLEKLHELSSILTRRYGGYWGRGTTGLDKMSATLAPCPRQKIGNNGNIICT